MNGYEAESHVAALIATTKTEALACFEPELITTIVQVGGQNLPARTPILLPRLLKYIHAMSTS